MLGEEHIKKLGFRRALRPSGDASLALHASRVQVTGSMMHDAENGNKERMLHLKITHMQLRNGNEGEHEETESGD